jgi:flagella basal body P-ring formation protein FlgA
MRLAGIVIAAVVLGLVGTLRAQGVIELLPAAFAEPGSPVTLAQVATLSGPDALAAGAIVVIPAMPADGDARLHVERVRQKLSDEKIRWSRVSLRGGECTVRPRPKAAPPAPAPSPAPAAPLPDHTGTLRSAVITRIAQITRSEPDDLRLTFDFADEQFLASPIAGRTVEIKPTAASDRLPLAITLFEGEHIATSRTIRVGVEVRRAVLVASVPKKKQETLGADDFTAQTQWLGLSVQPATRERALGAALKSRLQPGELITDDDLAPPIAVDKGEIVTVRCVSGGVALTTRGRAMAPARDGEIVKLQALDSPRIFSARMDGRGRAVLISTAGQDAAPQKPPKRPENPR